MKGKILSYNSDKGFGFISGQNNQKYFFHISNVENPIDIKVNHSVDFQDGRNNKGLLATNITVSIPSFTQDKFLKLGEHRIRASEIKRYRTVVEFEWNEYEEYDDGRDVNYLIIDTFDEEEIKIWLSTRGYEYNGISPENILNYLDEELSQ